jgi:uncharacterized phiE125 gp8 family phage protein
MLRTVTPPSGLAVSVADAKAHLRVDTADDDALIAALIAVATGMVESATQRRLITQTLDWVLPCWRPAIVLPVAPAQSVTSITYVDTTDTPQVLDPSGYTVLTRTNKVIVPSYGNIWPYLYPVAAEPLVIRFVVGYEDVTVGGEEPDDPADGIPVELLHMIKLQVAFMYENREPAVLGNTVPQKLPFFDALVDPFRWECP